MQPYKLLVTPAAANASGLASAVAVSGSSYPLTATTAADGLAHLITITGLAVTNHSGKTFTVTGVDADGQILRENLAGPNGAVAVTTTQYFLTVTSITVSASTGVDTFNIGWSAVAVSATFALNWREVMYQTSVAVAVTGTVTYTVQHTFDNLQETYAVRSNWIWWNHATLTSLSASKDSNYAFPVTGSRLQINAVTAGATVAYFVVQGS